MPFSYNASNPDRIVFTRLSAGCGRLIFLITGVIFSITGACLVYFMKDTTMPFVMFKYLVPVFGILAIYMSIRLPEIQSKASPDEIIFDNSNGRVEINQKVSEVNRAYIYYDEITGFVSIAKSHSSTNNSRTHTTYTYHVLLTKKDGGQWELLNMDTEQAAADEITKLKSLIKLDVSPKRVAVSAIPSKKYTITKGYQKVELNWRNKVRFAPLVLALFSIVFGLFSTVFQLQFSLPAIPLYLDTLQEVLSSLFSL